MFSFVALGNFEKEITLCREDIPLLFETTTIKSMSLANRFVRSATWEGMAKEGC